MVAEFKLIMHVIADRLHALPAADGGSELLPRKLRQLFGIAIAATYKINEHFVGQTVDRPLLGTRRDFIGKSLVGDNELVTNFEKTCRSHKPCANVPKEVAIVTRRGFVRQPDAVLCQKVGCAFGPHAKHEQHRRFLIALKRYVVANSNFHKSLRRKREKWRPLKSGGAKLFRLANYYPLAFPGSE